MEKKLVVGLGNPGKKYQKTRHNVGFMVLGALAAKLGVKFGLKKKLEAETAEIMYNSSPRYARSLRQPPLWKRGGASSLLQREGGGELLILAKPMTFMNDSGRALQLLNSKFRILNSNIIVVHDEIDLPLGKIKFSSGGSAGHKGIESIIENMGSGFQRLRIGIENRKKYRIPPTDDYVLQNFTEEEMRKLEDEVIPRAVNEIQKFWK